jgi:hypothetical protein
VVRRSDRFDRSKATLAGAASGENGESARMDIPAAAAKCYLGHKALGEEGIIGYLAEVGLKATEGARLTGGTALSS